MPWAAKSSFLNRITDLSLEINHINSRISFDKKPGFTLQIGDHFFLNLGPVLITFHCSLFAKLQKKILVFGTNPLLHQTLNMPIPSMQ
jgi:hypothetical protein